jgi:tetratricopeptide (TPR) repeat protein
VDHAHNWILEWTAENGLVGSALLLAFWASVLYPWHRWHRLYRDKPMPPALSAGAFAVFAGVGVENLFDVNSALPSTLVPLLFLAVFPAALYLGPQYSPEFPIRRVETDLSKIKVYLLPLFALFLGLSLYQVERAFQKQLDDARLKKALGFSQAQKWDEAIPLYGKILAADPSNLEAAYFRGASYADRALTGDWEKALADFEAVGRQSPDYVLLHFKKAQVLAWLGRNDESKVEMQKAVRLDPALISQWGDFQEARRLADAGRFPEAFVIYQRLFLDYPTCVPVMVDEANCLVAMKNYSAAIPLYALAAGFDPQDKAILGNLARTALATGEEAQLQNALTLLKKLDPKDPLTAELEQKLKGARP